MGNINERNGKRLSVSTTQIPLDKARIDVRSVGFSASLYGVAGLSCRRSDDLVSLQEIPVVNLATYANTGRAAELGIVCGTVPIGPGSRAV